MTSDRISELAELLYKDTDIDHYDDFKPFLSRPIPVTALMLVGTGRCVLDNSTLYVNASVELLGHNTTTDYGMSTCNSQHYYSYYYMSNYNGKFLSSQFIGVIFS